MRLRPEGNGALLDVPNDRPQTTCSEENVEHGKHQDNVAVDETRVQPERPSKYRPPSATSPPTRKPRSTPSIHARTPDNAENRPWRSEIELRILFERGGYCRASLLPKRPSILPETIRVSGTGGLVDLVALEDNWYQDIETDDLGRQLRSGIRWIHEATGQEWVLSGREIFVLAAGATHRGFVSTARLTIGREQAIACTTSILPKVEQTLREAECKGWTLRGEDDGVPNGWVVLHPVVPLRSVPLTDDVDILNVVRPLPEIQINLEGGIRLRYNEWLAGHPPSIHMYGDPEHTERVVIDGHEAELTAKGCYIAPNWDADGNHRVWCGGATTTYSLVRSQYNCEAWPAHSFACFNERSQIGICGPLVQSYTIDGTENQSARSNVVQVPASNPVLLGRFPWEVFVGVPRTDLVGAPFIASPPFSPVWAVPLQPLRCRKPLHCILLVGEPIDPGSNSLQQAQGADREAEHRWYSSILDAGRKGLPVAPDNMTAQNLWHRYKACARVLWKIRRRTK